jgi:hypothetical protein
VAVTGSRNISIPFQPCDDKTPPFLISYAIGTDMPGFR